MLGTRKQVFELLPSFICPQVISLHQRRVNKFNLKYIKAVWCSLSNQWRGPRSLSSPDPSDTPRTAIHRL